MFKQESFGVTTAQETLFELFGKFEYPASGDITEVNNILEKVLFDLQLYGDAPRYVLNRSLYPTVDGGDTLQSASFVIRPSSSHKLEVDDMQKKFIVNAGPEFFNTFISEIAQWFDSWQYHKKLQVNVDELNKVVAELVEENEIPFQVLFSYGYGLVDVSDNHVVVGLSAETIEGLHSLPLFDEDMESRVQGYKEALVETLKQCVYPYSIVKVRTNVTKDLGIYSRRTVNKLIREFVNRKIEHTRVGTGYVDPKDANYFAVVDKVAVTAEELESIDTTGLLVIDNTDASKKEIESGKTKIVVSYRVSPFDKETNLPVDLSLEDVIGYKVSEDVVEGEGEVV